MRPLALEGRGWPLGANDIAPLRDGRELEAEALGVLRVGAVRTQGTEEVLAVSPRREEIRIE